MILKYTHEIYFKGFFMSLVINIDDIILKHTYWIGDLEAETAL